MKKDLLLQIADLVDTISDREFNMSYWRYGMGCGTVGCAIGHAIVKEMIPGLVLSEPVPQPVPTNLYPAEPGSPVPNDIFLLVANKLGLKKNYAIFLFDPEQFEIDKEGDRITQAQVSSRIRAFVAQRS